MSEEIIQEERTFISCKSRNCIHRRACSVYKWKKWNTSVALFEPKLLYIAEWDTHFWNNFKYKRIKGQISCESFEVDLGARIPCHRCLRTFKGDAVVHDIENDCYFCCTCDRKNKLEDGKT